MSEVNFTILGEHLLKTKDLKSEDGVPKKKQSYLHFLSEDPSLVGVKCACVDWIFDGAKKDEVENIVEYMAGAGCASVILRSKFPNVKRHLTLDLSEACVEHLQYNGFESQVGDVNVATHEIMVDEADFKLVDYPFGSVITNTRGDWQKSFLQAFTGERTKYVSWTDSACSYPMAIHGANYANAMGSEKVPESHFEYFEQYNEFLYKTTGFSIVRVAMRRIGNRYGSSFILAAKGKHKMGLRVFGSSEYGNSITSDKDNSLW